MYYLILREHVCCLIRRRIINPLPNFIADAFKSQIDAFMLLAMFNHDILHVHYGSYALDHEVRARLVQVYVYQVRRASLMHSGESRPASNV